MYPLMCVCVCILDLCTISNCKNFICISWNLSIFHNQNIGECSSLREESFCFFQITTYKLQFCLNKATENIKNY